MPALFLTPRATWTWLAMPQAGGYRQGIAPLALVAGLALWAWRCV